MPAQPGWVEASCRNFMPDCLDLIEKTQIVYAREVFARNEKKHVRFHLSTDPVRDQIMT